MHIDPKSQIAGVLAIRVRDFLHRNRNFGWTRQEVVKRLNLSDTESETLILELLRLGYIQPQPIETDEQQYELTLDGATFSLASAARPLTRKTAQQKLVEFLERVQAVNTADRFVYRVRKVFIFGSYLTEKDRINDIDVAIELVYRETDIEKRESAIKACMERAFKAERQFSSIIEEVLWPYEEVLLFLKSRSRAISLHTSDDPILKRVETRVIFQDETVSHGSA